MSFLRHREPRSLADDAPPGWRPESLFLGNGAQALEIAVFTAPRKPTEPELRNLHDKRKRGRAAPVLVSVLWGNQRAALGWHDGTEELVRTDLELGQVERLCDAALDAPDRHAAHRLLAHALACPLTTGECDPGAQELRSLCDPRAEARRAAARRLGDRLCDALEAPLGPRDQRALREVMKSESSGPKLTLRIAEFVRERGYQPFHPPEALPPIDEDDVILVAWMAVDAAT